MKLKLRGYPVEKELNNKLVNLLSIRKYNRGHQVTSTKNIMDIPLSEISSDLSVRGLINFKPKGNLSLISSKFIMPSDAEKIHKKADVIVKKYAK